MQLCLGQLLSKIIVSVGYDLG